MRVPGVVATTLHTFTRAPAVAALTVGVCTLMALIMLVISDSVTVWGSVAAVILGAGSLAYLAAAFVQHERFRIVGRLGAFAWVPLCAVASLSNIGVPLTRTTFFGGGFEFGTSASLILIAAAGFLGALAGHTAERVLACTAVLAGLAGIAVFFGSSRPDLVSGVTALALSAALAVALHSEAQRSRIMFAVSAAALAGLFMWMRLPGPALAAAASVAIGMLPYLRADALKKPRTIAAAACIACLLISAAVPASGALEVQRAALPTTMQSLDILGAQYANSAREAIIGSGPASYEYAWNAYRPVSFNGTRWWNATPEAAASTALSVASLFGLFGLAALCLVPTALALTLRARRKTNEWGAATEAVAAFCVVSLFTFSPATPLLMLGAAALGARATARREDVDSYAPSFDATVAAACLWGAIACVILFTGIYQLRAYRDFSASESLQRRGYVATAVLPAQKASVEWPIAEYEIAAAQVTLNDALLTAQDQKKAGKANLEQFTASAAGTMLFAEEAVGSDPRNVEIHLARASLYALIYSAGFTSAQHIGDLPGQLTISLTRSAGLAPTRADVVFDAAVIAKLRQDAPTARLNAQKALVLKPDYVEAQALLRSLPMR